MSAVSAIASSKEYQSFRRNVTMQRKIVEHAAETERPWKFYDYGPKSVRCPLVFFPQVSGTAETYFRQIMALGSLNYRVISVDYAPYTTHAEFCEGFTKFIDHLGLEKVHIFGIGFGGFMAQLFAQYRGKRVESLILCNSFCDSRPFAKNAPFLGFSWIPEFALKRSLLKNFPSGDLPPAIADSVDFMVEQLETLDQESLASRMTLNAQPASITTPVLTEPHRVTIIETMDEVAISATLREHLRNTYPQARTALIKDGGNFPHLANSDEINMHIKIHLRPFLDGPASPQLATQGS